jgi:putative two-component system response regulator
MRLAAAIYDALRATPPALALAERIQALLAIAQIRYVSGDAMGSLEPAVDGLALARNLGDPLLLMRSLNTLGCALGDTIDLAGAIEFFREALELAITRKNRHAVASIWLNLGGPLLYAGQHTDAIRCYERTLQLCDGVPELDRHRGVALMNIALTCPHLGDVARGLAAAEDAVNLLNEPRDANDLLNRTLAETYYARLLLDVAHHEPARIRCAIARTYAERSGSMRALLSASIATGVVEVATGRADVGLSRLMKLLEQARLMRTAYRDALYALVSAHKTLGRFEHAEVFVRELMLQARANQRDYLHGYPRALLQETLRPTSATTASKPEAALADEHHPAWKRLARLAETASLRIDPTGEHPYRVGRLAALMAEAAGSSASECRVIELAARVHDVGMAALPDDVFGERADSASFERSRLRRHADVGAELLDSIDLDLARFAKEVVLHHHERYDGCGYPSGLIGNAIPFAARIVAVANAYDMLTHAGPKRGRKSIDQALDELVRDQGTKFDPRAVALCVAVVTGLRAEVPEVDEELGRAAQESPLLAARRSIYAMLATAP